MRNELVVIIDSGIDTENHRLMQHVEGGKHLIYQEDFIYSDEDINDCNGHGTNCADIILERNEEAQFYILKIINEEGLSRSELMLAALRECVEIPARTICMSLSITTKTCDSEKEIYETCKVLKEQGKFVCISENNEMEGSEPARFDQVIGVRAYYGGKKNTWMINEKEEIQVITDGNPIFSMGKAGRYNFFKGCSKANAFFSAVAMQYQKNENMNNMKEALTRIGCDSSAYEEDIILDLGIGRVAESESDEQMEKLIQETITEISGCTPELEELRWLPIMCKITGISYFNFYDFITRIYKKLGLAESDFHQLEANDICTLYRLRQFLKERVENEKKSRVLELLAQYKLGYFLILFLVMLDCVSTYLYPDYLSKIIDVAIPKKNSGLLIKNVIILAILQLLSLLISLLLSYIFSRISNSMVVRMKKAIIQSMFELNGEELGERSRSFTTSMNGDIDNVELLSSRVMADLILQITTVIITGVILVKINKIVLYFVLIVYPLLIVIQLTFNKKVEKRVSILMTRIDIGYSLIKEFVTYIYEYIVLRTDGYFLSRFMRNDKNVRKGHLKYNMLLAFNGFVPRVINAIVYLAILAISGYMVMEGEIMVGEFTIILLYTQRMFNPIASIMLVLGQIQGAKVSMERIDNMLIGCDGV